MPKVSIVVPVYNNEKYIDQCLQSIKQQSLKEIEVILVDDESTDGSVKLLEDYKNADSRFRLIHTTHGGGGTARNAGLRKITGEYVIFLDGDDFFEPDLCEVLYNKAVKTKADIVVCASDKYDTNNCIFESQLESFSVRDCPKGVFSFARYPEHIFNCFANYPWNKLFRSDFVKRNELWFQEIMRTNDLYFVNKALILAEKIATVNKILVHYRVGSGESCQGNNSEYPKDFVKAFLQLKELLDSNPKYEKYRRSYVTHALNGCIHNLFKQNSPKVQKELFDYLKDEGYALLGVSGHEPDYYYNNEDYETYELSINTDYEHFFQKMYEQQKEKTRRLLTSMSYRLGNFIMRPFIRLKNMK